MHPSPIRLVLLSLAAAAALQAAPLPKSQISGDAKWVVHLDMDQFAPSQTCRLLMNGRNGSKSLQSIMTHYQTLLGVDPLKDISSLTLYGTEITGTRGTALISGTLNRQAITRQLSSYPQYAVRNYGKRQLQTWTDKSTGRPLWACFYTSRQLILASDEDSVLSAAAILDGSRPNLANSKSVALPMQAVREGTFFTAITKGYAGSPSDPVKALILKQTEAAVMQLSEKGKMVDGSILLRAVSPDTANQIHQILNGLIFSSTLTDSASPIAKLAGMSEVTQENRDVLMTLHCPAGEAADILSATLLAP